MSTTLACTIFAALCGSSPATDASIGRISVGSMTRRGYDPGFAVGTVAGGTLGIMIPPSITFVIYGILTETSIARLPRDRCHHPRHDGGCTRQRYH